MTTTAGRSLDAAPRRLLPAPRRGRASGVRLGRRAGYSFVAPFFILFAAFGLYPFIYTAWVSLHHVELTNINKLTWTGAENYIQLLKNPRFWNAFWNTFWIGVIGTVPQLLMALGLAHLLNYKLRGRTFFRVAMLAPYATSIAAATLIFAQLYGRDYGLINWLLHLVGIHPVDWESGTWTSKFAIGSIVIWRWTGYNALIYLAGMQSIPSDLYEAASIDGASRWQDFRFITIPSLRPTILFTIVTSTIGSVQIFGEPLLFASGLTTAGGGLHQYQTLGLLMYEQGWSQFHLGQAAATAWIMFVIIVAIVGSVGLVARHNNRVAAGL